MNLGLQPTKVAGPKRFSVDGMVRTEGGPCVGVKKRKKKQGVYEAPELCGAVESHKWYRGPTCKNCYERRHSAVSNRRWPRTKTGQQSRAAASSWNARKFLLRGEHSRL